MKIDTVNVRQRRDVVTYNIDGLGILFFSRWHIEKLMTGNACFYFTYIA